jgi:hypothetical protein
MKQRNAGCRIFSSMQNVKNTEFDRNEKYKDFWVCV